MSVAQPIRPLGGTCQEKAICNNIVANRGLLADNPLLSLLGRRGRGAVVGALRARPGRAWNLRELGRAARVHPIVAGRAVRELAALGAVEAFRPGRDMVVRWRAASPAARALAVLDLPDLRQETAAAFADAYEARADGSLRRWQDADDDPADPMTPTRIAIIVGADEDAALERVGPALDAVTAAGWPPPEVAVFRLDALDAADPVAAAILAGALLRP